MILFPADRRPGTIEVNLKTIPGKTSEEVFMYQDKTLICRDCDKQFVFTASEQEFYNEKGFANEPGRCPECRRERKQQGRGGFGSAPREMHDVVCAACGIETRVPFRPTGDRPVYCRDCYTAQIR